MAVRKPEQILALALGVLVGGILLYWGFASYQSMFSTRETQLAGLRQQVATKQKRLDSIHKAIARRRDLEKRSLPNDKTIAPTLYQSWLYSLIEGKLADSGVIPNSGGAKPKGYTPYSFRVKGQGSLEQIIKVLYDFYAANHLHQITRLDLKPVEKSNALNLTMDVEAIILERTKRNDALTTEPGNNLALANFNDYQKVITGRNLFSEYKPPSAVVTTERRAEPTFDLAKLAYLTMVGHGVDGRPTAWVYERNVNKTTKLFVGDQFQVAGLKGTVKRIDIDSRYVELEIDGKPVTVSQDKSLGETLAERQKNQKQ